MADEEARTAMGDRMVDDLKWVTAAAALHSDHPEGTELMLAAMREYIDLPDNIFDARYSDGTCCIGADLVGVYENVIQYWPLPPPHARKN